MKFLNHDIKLAIFDLDGTLISSTSVWSDIDSNFFISRGMKVPEDYGESIAHVGLEEAAKITREKYAPNETEENILNEWITSSQKAYEEYIPLKNNVHELLELLKEHNVHIALATANAEELYLPCIKRLGIEKFFEFVINPKNIKGGKSTTKIYDIVKEHFSVNDDEVVIFEDSLEPIRVASSKYLVVGVYDKHSVKNAEENKQYSNMYIEDFQEIIDEINKVNQS